MIVSRVCTYVRTVEPVQIRAMHTKTKWISDGKNRVKRRLEYSTKFVHMLMNASRHVLVEEICGHENVKQQIETI